jgi:phage terminase large subunit-like protein
LTKPREFPNGKHDDDVDAMTQFLNLLRVVARHSANLCLGFCLEKK